MRGLFHGATNGLGQAPYRYGAVAQLGERCNRTAEVTGSIPVSSIGTTAAIAAMTIEIPGMVLAKFGSCPPLLGRTESSNDSVRGNSLKFSATQ